jgi:archaellum component FlaG (FlaF/FlaG flagellin family)
MTMKNAAPPVLFVVLVSLGYLLGDGFAKGAGEPLPGVNETVYVPAGELSDSGAEGFFRTPPNGQTDLIHVENPCVKGLDAGPYKDPIDDCADVRLTHPGSVVAEVEGRLGVGAMYWVTVITVPCKGGGSGAAKEPEVLRADVKDTDVTHVLTLRDQNSNREASDETDPVENPIQVVYCSPNPTTQKGDIEFLLSVKAGCHVWAINRLTPADTPFTAMEGFLTSDNNWTEKKEGFDPGRYRLEVKRTCTGQTEFARTIDFVVTNVKIIATPRAVAADAEADVPLYFKINGVEKAEVESATVKFFLGEEMAVSFNTSTAFVTGDAVRECPGSGKANGDVNDYTVLIPENRFDSAIPPGNSHRTLDAHYKIVVTYNLGQDSISSESPPQAIQVFTDATIEVVELDVDEKIAAFKEKTGQKTMCNGPAIPCLRHERSRDRTRHVNVLFPHWDLQDLPPEQSETPLENASGGYALGFDKSVRRRIVPDENKGYALEAELYDDTDILVGDLYQGEAFTTEITGEERGVLFVVYYGRDVATDFGGRVHQVVDIRKKDGTIGVALFNGLTFTITCLGVPDGLGYDWVSFTSNSLWVTAGLITLFSPEGFSKTAAALTGIAAGLTPIIASILPAKGPKIDEDADTASAGACGGYAIYDKNGGKDAQEFDSNLGAPGKITNTQQTNGSRIISGAVVTGPRGALVLQSWRVFHKAEGRATSTSVHPFFTARAYAKIECNYPDGFTSESSAVVTGYVSNGTVEGEYNEGED